MSHNLFDISGKTAIVTGCTTGLGQGQAVGLAEAGVNIIGVDYVDQTDETKKLVEATGSKYHYIKADLSSLEPIERIISESLEKLGKIDILVNNAGIIRREDSINFTEKDWDDVMNVNAKATFFLSQAVVKQFIKQGNGGKIINNASMLSFQGGIRVPSYTASKSGVLGLTRIMANEWAKHGVNVNAIAPGYMATNNTEALRADEKRNAEILERIPADRWGTPDDLKGPVIFLSSKASDYINGYTIAVDGGWLSR